MFSAIACKGIHLGSKGGQLGAAGGELIGSVIGAASGNAEAGAAIGASLGETTGLTLAKKMDNQAADLRKAFPGMPVHQAGETITMELRTNVLFGVNRFTLTPEARQQLDQLASVLKKYPETSIEVQGHTDAKGREAYNLALSEKRAKAVSAYLAAVSIDTSRIITKGFGEIAPRYDNLTDTGRMANRRVEFVISANEKMAQDGRNESGKQ